MNGLVLPAPVIVHGAAFYCMKGHLGEVGQVKKAARSGTDPENARSCKEFPDAVE
jgi:hypothetical protein